MNARLLMALAAAAALVSAGIGSADAFYYSSLEDYDNVQALQDCVKSKGLESADYIMQLAMCTSELYEYGQQIDYYGGPDYG